MQTYNHKFRNGVTAKATLTKKPLGMNIEWSAKPGRELLPEYFTWRREIMDDFTRRTGLRIMVVDLGVAAL